MAEYASAATASEQSKQGAAAVAARSFVLHVEICATFANGICRVANTCFYDSRHGCIRSLID